MNDSYEINVTRKHIRAGVMRDHFKCPVALAILDTIKDASLVTVSKSFINVYWAGVKNPYYKTMVNSPTEVIDFIIQFDNAQHVKPFKFTLKLT